MNELRANASSAKDDPGSRSDGVIWWILRRLHAFGLTLIALLVFTGVLGWVVRGRYREERPSEPAQARPLLPLPVTFIPPTPEQQAVTGRFQVSADDDPAIGPGDAPVLIVEFSDFQCQYCGIFARETLHPLLERYKDQIRFVYRDFVIYGPMSLQAAVAAECANEQGAFWPYHDRLFERQNSLTPDFFLAMADELNLDTQQFARCVGDPAVEDEVKADTAAGRALGLRGTPTFYINGRILVGAQPLEAFAAVIDEELALVAAETPDNTLLDTPNDP